MKNKIETYKLLYDGFSLICHQLTSRSLCLFDDGIRDCVAQADSKEKIVTVDGKRGYKFPVCSRDMSFYFFMLVGGILLPFFMDVNSKKVPPIYLLVIAIAPMAIDGLTQAIGLRESTNFIRIVTGGIAGFVVPFYLIPALNFVIDK